MYWQSGLTVEEQELCSVIIVAKNFLITQSFADGAGEKSFPSDSLLRVK
jgi:hypothetical protein